MWRIWNFFSVHLIHGDWQPFFRWKGNVLYFSNSQIKIFLQKWYIRQRYFCVLEFFEKRKKFWKKENTTSHFSQFWNIFSSDKIFSEWGRISSRKREKNNTDIRHKSKNVNFSVATLHVTNCIHNFVYPKIKIISHFVINFLSQIFCSNLS